MVQQGQVFQRGAAGVTRICGTIDQWSSDRTRRVTVNRAVSSIKSIGPLRRPRPARLRGGDGHAPWTVASPTNRSAQMTIIGNDDMEAPGISVEVPDVDAARARAGERGLEIAYSLRDEERGIRRLMLREPSGTLVNVVEGAENGRGTRAAMTRAPLVGRRR